MGWRTNQHIARVKSAEQQGKLGTINISPLWGEAAKTVPLHFQIESIDVK